MKANGIRTIVIRGVLLILLSLYFIIVFGQKSTNLVSFNANRTANNISLQWQLADSNNLSTVIIEKKSEDDTYQPVAEFWVNFDGNTETRFRFTDKKVAKKPVYYRLKLISGTGMVEYSSLVSASEMTTIKKAGKNPVTAFNKTQTTPNNDFTFVLILLLQEREVNIL
jgi:hypothetical protein